jgi:hypothetical protein
MSDVIKVRVKRPKGKKNNNIVTRGADGKPRYITNATAKKDEKTIANLLVKEAKKAGWDIPITSYVELDIEYDALIDEILITVTKLEEEPSASKWGGRYDIQNIVDTVADALEENKRHDGILFNDNRISRVLATRNPLLSKPKPKNE